MKSHSRNSYAAATFSHFATLFLLVFGLLVAGCSDNSTGTNGGNGGGGNGGGGGNTIGTEPTFSNVQAILEQSCGGSSCHIGGRNSGVRLDGYQNVTESNGEQYNELIVQTDDPAGSPLIDKLRASPTFGSRMPQGGPYLSSDRIDQIQSWIEQGAQNN